MLPIVVQRRLLDHLDPREKIIFAAQFGFDDLLEKWMEGIKTNLFHYVIVERVNTEVGEMFKRARYERHELYIQYLCVCLISMKSTTSRSMPDLAMNDQFPSGKFVDNFWTKTKHFLFLS